MIKTTSQPGAYQTEFASRQARAMADAPVDKGGGGNGFGAHELLEAALAVCINMAVRMRAAEHSIPLDSVSTRVRLERSHPEMVCFYFALELVGLTP